MRSPIRFFAACAALVGCIVFTGCATTPTGDAAAAAVDEPRPAAAAATADAPAGPFASTYRPLPSVPTLITGAVVLTGTGERLDGASLLMVDGKIAALGPGLEAPAGARVIDAAGRWVTPGLIDVHSHLGIYASPGVEAHSDGNEMTDPVTAEVWAEHGVWPQDPGFVTALAGGVTSLQVLPGSVNLIGGRGVTLKNVPARTTQAMKFPGAPYGLKMACGENPKRHYGGRGRSPMTRMGNVAGYREAWIEAEQYRREWREWRERQGEDEGPASDDRGRGDRQPRRDLAMETLVGVLDGEILVHNHCYRADEMAQMIDLAKEFGYRITAFHHGVEAYKVADLLAENGICGALWADWWGFKMEAWDGVRENLALVDAAPGGCAIVHSDSEVGIQRLNQEAAKSMAAAERAGLPVPRERAIGWITSNAARALGIDGVTGSLEVGKNADVVLWSTDPFSVYALADQVWIDGALAWDREDPARQPRTDFSVGMLPDEPFSPRPATLGGAAPAARTTAAAPPSRTPPAASRPAVLEGETVAITGATVHTAGAAGTLENATVVIAAGRIAAVGRDVAVPPGTRVIDGRGRIVTPGLFDSMTRLGVVEVGAVAGTRDTSTDDDRITAALRVTDAYNPESTLIAVTRVEGLTRALVAPSPGSSLIAGQAAVVHLGLGSDPVVAAPAAMIATLGERGARLAGGSRSAALLTLREALEDASDYAAHRAAWARGERRDYALSRLDLEALVPVVEGRLPLVVSVDRASDVRTALALAAEHGLRLVIAGGAEAWRLADEIAAAGVPVLIDPLENLPGSFETLGATLENAARLHAAGVTVALASEDAHNARNLRQAAGNAVAHGLPRDAALAAMTSVPAAIWGLADHVGTLEPGREADVVVWDGDPFEVTTYPVAVFVRGREMPADSRQLRLRDRYRELPAAGELPVAYPR
jgi:imidazolonepropionase-like amidohydrolase